jgi:predicted ATPase
MLLHDLHIGGYRGLRDLHLEGLGRVNVLIGQNNSGKSSVLEAAALLARPFDDAQWTRVIQSRDSFLSDTPPHALWELFPCAEPLLFGGTRPKAEAIQLRGELSSGLRTLEAVAHAQETAERLPGGDLRIEVTAVLSAQNGNESGHYRLTRGGLISTAGGQVRPALQSDRAVLLSPWSRLSSSWAMDLLSTAIEQGKKTDAIAMLRLFDSEIDGLEIIKRFEQGRILVQHRTRGMPSLSTFGAGVHVAMTMAAAVSKARGGLLLVDEIETGIHHSMLVEVCSHLFAMAAASDVQVFCTTHSLETIDALVTAAERSQQTDALCGYRLDRSEREHTVRRYQGAKLSRLREGGVDLR